MIHTIEIKVRGYHVDIFRHVNNARYLEFLEEARWAFAEGNTNFLNIIHNGYDFNVVNININYRRPAATNDVLIIETELAKINRRSGVIRQTIKLKDTDKIIVDADITFILLDIKQNKAAVFEGEILYALEKLRNGADPSART